MNAIDQRLAEILTDQLKVDRAAIDTDVTLDSLDIDSLVVVELALILEKEFAVPIPDGEITKEMTVGDVAHLIEDKSGGPGATV